MPRWAACRRSDTIVLERFFDEAGGMQLVVHSPFGSRLNRAWGLALRKRFCRKFNFELQAAATEDAIVLSLTDGAQLPARDVPRYLHSATVRDVLIQAVLDSPMFTTRWRWVSGVSLALPRFRGGRKVPPQLARMAAEDLIGAVFPDQIACAENLPGEREIPDHPLVRQTHRRLPGRGDGCRRPRAPARAASNRATSAWWRAISREPSPLALEILTARPYAFLDDAPLEERRTQAVMARRWLAPEQAAELGRLDAEAIERVREEAWPDAANADELHDAPGLARLPDRRTRCEAGAGWRGLARRARAAHEARGADRRRGHADVWIAAERLPQFRRCGRGSRLEPPIAAPAAVRPANGRATRRWSRSCAAGSKGWDR